MSCECNKARPLPSCVTNLTIGYGDDDTDYIVLFKTPDGRIDYYEVTSEDDGKIVVESPKFRINTIYEVWVTLLGGAYVDTDINIKETITVGETEVQCLYLQFNPVFEDGDVKSLQYQTVGLE